MAKTQVKRPDTPLATTPDTTVIKKPYINTPNEHLRYNIVEDSSVMKGKYNRETVVPSMMKRNAERQKEGKAPISYKSLSGLESSVYGLASKGKSFKEAPLKRIKKK